MFPYYKPMMEDGLNLVYDLEFLCTGAFLLIWKNIDIGPTIQKYQRPTIDTGGALLLPVASVSFSGGIRWLGVRQ